MAALAALLAVVLLPQPASASEDGLVDPDTVLPETGTDQSPDPDPDTDDEDTEPDFDVPESEIAKTITSLIAKGVIDIPDENYRTTRFCFFGIGSCSAVSVDHGYHDCDGNFVNEVGVNWNISGNYDSIHVKPSWQARASVISIVGGAQAFAAATSSTAWTMYDQMRDCLADEGLLSQLDILSWSSIWQQLHCHIAYNLFGGGGSWDLEGNRPSNWFGYLNPLNECSW